MTTIAERVATGAALLDLREPGWWQRIDLAKLDIDSCQNCVLGQLYGSPMNDPGVSFDPDYGFDIADYDYRSRATSLQHARRLTAAWRELIESRRAAP